MNKNFATIEDLVAYKADVYRRYLAAIAADNAWSEALVAKYGKAAGDARYDRRGRATAELETLYQAKLAADLANMVTR